MKRPAADVVVGGFGLGLGVYAPAVAGVELLYVVAVQDLDLVAPLEVHAAVAARLAFLAVVIDVELQVQPAVAELPPGYNAAGTRGHFQGAVLESPFDLRARLVGAPPLRQVARRVQQNDRVGRWPIS